MHPITYAVSLPIVVTLILYVLGRAVTLRWNK